MAVDALDAGMILAATTHTPADQVARGAELASAGTTASACSAGVVASASAAASAGADAVTNAQAAVTAMRQLGITAADAGSWSVANRREVLDLVRAAIDGLGTVRGAVLVAERDSQTWKGTGAGSFEGWVGTASREGKKAATKQVREAEQLDTVVEVTSAVTGGEIGLEHAKLIARLAAEGTPVQRAVVVSPSGQAYLIGLARVQDLPTFAVTLARWAAELDPVGVDDAHEARRRERYLHVAVGDDMTVVKGQLDNVAGRHLLLALEALTPAPASASATAPGERDVRDIGQRNADALETMARSVLASADTKPGAHVPVQISFILTEATWLAAKAARDARRAALTTFGLPAEPEDAENVSVTSGTSGTGGSGDASVPVSYAPATWEDGTPVPSTVLAAAMW